MYRFYINNIDNNYHYGELCREFLSDEEFEVYPVRFSERDKIYLSGNSYLINKCGSEDRDAVKRELYKLLTELFGNRTEWGTLTGVRPLKLALDLYRQNDSIEEMRQTLKRDYLISDSKTDLLTEIAEYQLSHLEGNPSEKTGIYVGIPFCPTRCAYCAFASNVASDSEIEEYLDKLLLEIAYYAGLSAGSNSQIESVYIGGGTPTTLNAEQLERLINKLKSELNICPEEIEFTIEAGRPDTITAEKLSVMKKHGISRISINPQTMKAETLELIGRRHSPEDIIRAYKLAAEYDFDVINADLIAGLPGESIEDFRNSLDTIIGLGANNITVHTLSVKRGSRLREDEPEYYRENAEVVSEMLDYSRIKLSSEGFIPYYIYRQKHQIGCLENVGYCRENTHSVYNIRIMEEKQTIVAFGAGGIGKVYYPAEDRLERVANVSNYKVYNERFEEMLERKKDYFK